MKTIKGLRVDVYRNGEGYDCTLNGITSKQNRLTLVDETISGPVEVEGDEVYLVLVRRNLFGGVYLHAEPRINGERISNNMCMAGGNFIYTSDSRFPSRYPISVHDRFESQELYNKLSQ